MKLTSYLIASLILALFLGNVACTKYVAGPKGDPGTPGGAGNLVLKQFSVTVDSSDWSQLQLIWVADVFSEDITKNVIEKGEIKVYLYTDSDWWVLPHGKNYIFTQYSVQEGKLRLTTEHIHGGVPARPATAKYRLVILAPAQ